ncbi:unnamed protein product [Sphenostylis stenocarpa]|uniref:MICOS complex subunit MIC10 n=1 Tax=Sphenostylis stenocarpa TaxID=92480 RepID=A0AA86SGX6_9FABA|nr:unnamed protein product [Sphenostylis stenocarpa]
MVALKANVRSPVTRWASIAFGAGVGIGSAYAECSRLFDGSPTKLPLHNVSETASQCDDSTWFRCCLRGRDQAVLDQDLSVCVRDHCSRIVACVHAAL